MENNQISGSNDFIQTTWQERNFVKLSNFTSNCNLGGRNIILNFHHIQNIELEVLMLVFMIAGHRISDFFFKKYIPKVFKNDS